MEVATQGFSVNLAQATWFKSSKSGPNCDNCVEVAFVSGAIAVRDSKNAAGSVTRAPQWQHRRAHSRDRQPLLLRGGRGGAFGVARARNMTTGLLSGRTDLVAVED